MRVAGTKGAPHRGCVQVSVHTSDLPAASSNGPVRVILRGVLGASDAATLDARALASGAGTLAPTDPLEGRQGGGDGGVGGGALGLYVFGRGSAALFVLEGRQLGELQLLSVSYEGPTVSGCGCVRMARSQTWLLRAARTTKKCGTAAAAELLKQGGVARVWPGTARVARKAHPHPPSLLPQARAACHLLPAAPSSLYV